MRYWLVIRQHRFLTLCVLFWVNVVCAGTLYTDDLTKIKPMTPQEKRLKQLERRMSRVVLKPLPKYYIDLRLGSSQVFLSNRDSVFHASEDTGMAYGMDLGYQLNNYAAFELGWLNEPNEKRVYPNDVVLHGRHNQAVHLAMRYNVSGSRYDTDVEAWVKGGVSWVHHQLALEHADDFDRLPAKAQERVGSFDRMGGYVAVGFDWAPAQEWGISTTYEVIITTESKIPTVSMAAVGVYYLF